MGQQCCSFGDAEEEVDHLGNIGNQLRRPLLDSPELAESHDDHMQCHYDRRQCIESRIELEKQIARLEERSKLQEELSGRRVRETFVARVFKLPKTHQSEFRDLIVHCPGENTQEDIELQAINTNPEPPTQELVQPTDLEKEAIPAVRHKVRCLKKAGSPELVPSAEQVINKLTALLEDKNIDLNVTNYPVGTQSTQGPVLVFCAAFNRDVASDAGLALAGVEGSEEVLLVVMHHVQNRPARPNYCSAEYLQHLKLKLAVDVVFFQDDGVYECPQNRNAVESLSRFFEGRKPVAQYSECEASL